MVNAMTEMARPCREKKSRKIFDPADHETPGRKRKISSSPTPPTLNSEHDLNGGGGGEGNAVISSLSPAPTTTMVDLRRDDEQRCRYCGLRTAPQRKGRSAETLLRCKDCPTIVHPSCMDYTEELTRKILTASWQCINCKTCSLCQDGHDDEMMLFCDACDLGYHMSCHRPPLIHKPAGRWECYQCNPQQQPSDRTRSKTKNAAATTVASTAASSDYYAENSYSLTSTSRRSSAANAIPTTNGFHSNSGSASAEVAKFMPLLPPQLHPQSGHLPDNWEEYPVDPSIPDCRNWEPAHVMNHFVQRGFSNTHAAVFASEEIDGSSLLLLHRQDVIQNLGLKLGPALRMFHEVKRLQTRRNLPS